MKISLTVLSSAAVPLGMLWLTSGIVYGVHAYRNCTDAISFFWEASLFVGGPISAVLAGGMFSGRRREKSRFQPIDRLVLVIAVLGTIMLLVMLLLMWLHIQRLNQQLPPNLRASVPPKHQLSLL